MGFASAQLSTPVKDLSGGQKRRLQLLLILLEQPNVLILDEPTNDLDTDMLAAMEDLLDSWPGTLIVVSHDRYFLERVTDQQYAILDGRLRHLPGGVDEYLRLARGASERDAREHAPAGRHAAAAASASPALAGAELRAAQKELAALERRLEKLESQIAAARTALADHDQADYVGLGAEMARIGDARDRSATTSRRAGSSSPSSSAEPRASQSDVEAEAELAQQAGEPLAVAARERGEQHRLGVHETRDRGIHPDLPLVGEGDQDAAPVVGVRFAAHEPAARRAGRCGWSSCRSRRASAAAAASG